MKINVIPLADTQNKSRPNENNLGFGKYFTDRMFIQKYSTEKRWYDAKIEPYHPLSLDPAAAVFHYGQEIFEGLKAYRTDKNTINLFRPFENAKRFNRSAARMSMPTIDENDHVDAISQLVKLEKSWIPSSPDTSLYIRPTMIATDAVLGVHASHHYTHFVILSPVGAYFAAGLNPISVYISDTYRRSVKGGTGEAKTGGNYGASLIVGEEASKYQCSQVLWLDAVEGKFVEEVGSMNICFVYRDGHIVTPPLSGSILSGITRMSILELAPSLGHSVSEARVPVDKLLADIKSGEVTEVFGTGTAAVIAPVGSFIYQAQSYVIGGNQVGTVTQKLRQTLTDIQTGRAKDTMGWVHPIY